MSEKIIYLLQRILRKTWWRCALFSLFAVLAVVLSTVLGPYIAQDVALKLGSDSIDSLLNILASSMLTVAIFSASTMVSAFGAVANSATPRASQLLIEDTTIQNTLAAFIGAFLYSVIALVGLHAHIYGDGGRLVLFGFTVAMLLLVVIVLLRWIDYLSVLGRLGETIRRVEAATIKAMNQRLEKPFLGGQRQPPGARGANEVMATTTGFVQHVSMDLLQTRAKQLGAPLHLHVLPGAFVEPTMALASSDGPLDDDARKAVQDAVLMGPGRTFDHDPRFGLVVMGEIAARALSAAVNDPGTSFDVLATGVKVLGHWSAERQRHDAAGQPVVAFEDVTVPGLREAGMLEDVFTPIARYGAEAVEVGITLQRALRSVSRLGGDLPEAARVLSRYALERAAHGGLGEGDLALLRAAAEGH
ncbi:hypothetical protein RD110_03850 [Rhodoferax koreense]|uniref:DUF2254 domain-containing protein n=1 Tax=Rhodoferax koreensis TaxID=1842727 RepID=A0A1P8JRT9_9BURK|nr:DUF2254 domain-containing protein [Rhodoferax koreense]APW36438.1 hypothetical protein RD110_03850 [Rhodoferax koreense]